MKTEPTNLAELHKALAVPNDYYSTGGGCYVVEIGLPTGRSLIFTDWANETGFDVGLYDDWANDDEPLFMFGMSPAETLVFAETFVRMAQLETNGQQAEIGN
jgi:hypothetical protein